MEAWHNFFNRTVPNMVLRIASMFIGMALVAVGIAISRATDLGVSAISALPNVLSFITPLTIGFWTFILNLVFVVAQIVLLRRKFNPLQFLSLPFIFVFSGMIDFFVPLCAAIPMDSYLIKLFYSVATCFIIALGVLIQAQAALVLVPGDGIVVTISRVFHVDFGKAKMGFDVSLIIAAALLSLIALHSLTGVREGSVIAAVLVGFIIRLCRKHLPDLELLIPTKGHNTLIPTEDA